MPVHSKKITDSVARTLRAPDSSYAIFWCPETTGFGVRVTSAGARAWVSERRVDGKTIRRTLGKAVGRDAISADAARKLQIDVSSELQRGTDRVVVKREQRVAEKRDAITFEQALRDYVAKKRRAKDGLPLKERTKTDYLAALDAPREIKSIEYDAKGKRLPPRLTQGGVLHSIAQRSIFKMTAGDITKLYELLADRGERQQTYAMQIVRAVLRYFGVTIADNPLSPTTAGAKRVHLVASGDEPMPIPLDRLGAWWRVACAVESPSADQLRFQLLCGLRPGEVGPDGVRVRQFDAKASSVMFLDTKNRRDHLVLLSKQAEEIAARAAKGKKLDDPLFGVADAGKTLAAINAAADVPREITPHKLRDTFASIAEELVSAGTLKRLLNHAATGDVTQTHYIGKSAEQLRAGWQVVADFIEAAAREVSKGAER